LVFSSIMNYKFVFVVVLKTIIITVTAQTTTTTTTTTTKTTTATTTTPTTSPSDSDSIEIPPATSGVNISRKVLYMSGFGVKRAEQVEGVKRIQKLKDYSKRYKMVDILLQNLFKVLLSAKVQVIEMGYIPGEEFPEAQEHLDALGHVLENVALFGDLILRVPDVTHKLYNKKEQGEWRVAMNWGFMFANATGVFEGSHATLLHLAAQELEIIPREENYINPYREAEIKARKKEELEAEEKRKKKKEEKKKKKKAKRKGPRLGGGAGEL